jgi:flagellar assembly protein FliH
MLAKLFRAEAARVECAPFVLPTEEDLPGNDAHPESGLRTEAEPSAMLEEPNLAAQAEAEAAAVMNAARAEAHRIVAQAESQAAEIERQALERGLREAQAAMNAEVSRAAADLREQFARSLAELADLRRMLAAEAERELVRLALEIARKVVRREVAVDPDIPLMLARVALARVHRAAATVRLHPDDFEYVNSRREELRAGAMIEVVADPAVGRGGCVVVSERGDIDARLEQQFAVIERGFLHAS